MVIHADVLLLLWAVACLSTIVGAWLEAALRARRLHRELQDERQHRLAADAARRDVEASLARTRADAATDLHRLRLRDIQRTERVVALRSYLRELGAELAIRNVTGRDHLGYLLHRLDDVDDDDGDGDRGA